MPPADTTSPAAPGNTAARITLLCFAHLRWNFVYQRPQHLMSRAAVHADVFFIESRCLLMLSLRYFAWNRSRAACR
jgi:hypothetical protein